MASDARILIVAGEASGDHHGACLVQELKQCMPGARLYGVAGPRMRAAGVEVLVDSASISVVGLFEVLAHFPTLYGALRRLRRSIREDPPDLVILIDFPDFNLRIARAARAAGVKVLYYISPQVWAWRPKRVHRIARLVDHMAVVFPFEVPFYERAGVPVTFVGHPLVEEVPLEESPADARKRLGLDPDRATVGLFPGSRRGELKRMMPDLLAAAVQVHRRRPGLQFVLPLADSLEPGDLDHWLPHPELPVHVVRGEGASAIRACDAIVTASGTVTLEIALARVPMLIVYRVSALTFAIVKRLVRVDHIGLCNIVAGRRIVPELIQDQVRPETIAGHLERLLEDTEYRHNMQAELAPTRERLGGTGASARVAALVRDLLVPGEA